MTINMTARSTTIRDSFKNSLEKKLRKVGRFFDDEAVAKVTVTNEGGRETVEITIVSGEMIFRSEKTTGDRLDSLDVVVDALFRQIVKNKDKLQKRMRKTAFDPGYDQDFIGAEDKHEIVRNKSFKVRAMDAEEAVLQLNLIGHSFYMFRNNETGEINVVYRRNDGTYGVLSPEDE
jgi:putative sigma-54 modulation protein